jgi:acyl-CoA dehydrogenase
MVEMATDIEMGRVFLDGLIAVYMDGKDVVTKVPGPKSIE